MEETFRDDFEYSGPIALCGGGPTGQQQAAANSQANLNNQLATTAQQNENYTEAQRNKTTPFYSNEMTNGPGYYNAEMDAGSGINARAYAPAKAQLVKTLGGSTGLPSGYKDQALTDFNENQAQGYDSGILGAEQDKQATQERGAAGLMGEAQQANPLGYYQGAMTGNSSLINGNLRKPGLAGTIGGLVGSAAKAYAA
jgi:hypothetical protein